MGAVETDDMELMVWFGNLILLPAIFGSAAAVCPPVRIRGGLAPVALCAGARSVWRECPWLLPRPAAPPG